MAKDDLERFAHLTYDDFRRMAADASLSKYEKIGFPNSYREGKEPLIFQDLVSKLSNLSLNAQTVLDIGPGCSDLATMVIEHCGRLGSELVLVDSKEMLVQLPDAPFIHKTAGRYPQCEDHLARYRGAVDVIICYSVFHYLFDDGAIWTFLDQSLELLADGGQMLIGDIPNVSKRKRFFSSAAGVRAHQEFTGRDERPEVHFNVIDGGKIDDSVIYAVIMRARSAGFDAYVLPQDPRLPMANRREDVLICKP